MYPISQTLLDILKSGEYNQHIDISVTPTSGAVINLTEEDILSSGFEIDRYSVAGNYIGVGAASASEVTLRLDNRDGRYNSYRFEGAELYIRLNIRPRNGGGNNYIPLGYFTVDNTPRKLFTISLTALDRMVHFDRYITNSLAYPATVRQIIQNACDVCNITCATNLATLRNGNFTVPVAPPITEDITYRTLIQWCCEISGTCAYIDWEGKLRLEWYGRNSIDITPSERYTSDVFETEMQIAGVDLSRGDTVIPLINGVGNYRLRLEGNLLIQDPSPTLSFPTVAGESPVVGLAYTPCVMDTIFLPHLYPMDKINLYTTTADGTITVRPSYITHTTWRLHGRTHIESKGITETKSGYATLNPMTTREREIIANIAQESVGDEIDEQLSQMEQATLLLNEMMFNSLGLYFTSVDDGEGGTKTYAHNAPTLEGSATIYTMTAGGFAFTNAGWNGGNPVWQYGISKDGNAVFNSLNVYRLSADLINAGTMTADHIRGGTLILGGVDNVDGWMEVRNAAGLTVVRLDNAGATITSGNINLTAIDQNEGKIQINYDDGLTRDLVMLAPHTFVMDTEWRTAGQTGRLMFSNGSIYVTRVYLDGTAARAEIRTSRDGSIVTADNGKFKQGTFNDSSAYSTWGMVKIVPGVITMGKQINDGADNPTFDFQNIIMIGGNTPNQAVMYLYGSFIVNGTKNKMEDTPSYGKKLLYCYEMTSPMYGDVGHGRTDENGVCYIGIDPVFYETIDNSHEYYVFLQKYGEGDIYVAERQADYFVVRGTPDMEFAWEIKAKQQGYATERLEDLAEPDVEAGEKVNPPPEAFAEFDLMADEILNEYEMEIMDYGEN